MTRSASDSPRPPRHADRVVDTVREEHAVGQAGEVVVQRLVLQRLGVGLALGDVAHAADVDRAGAELDVAQVELHGNVEPSLRRPTDSAERLPDAEGQSPALGLGAAGEVAGCFGPTICEKG